MSTKRIIVFFLILAIAGYALYIKSSVPATQENDNLKVLMDCIASQNSRPTNNSPCAQDWFRSKTDPKNIDSSLKLIHDLYESGEIAGNQCHVFEDIAASVAYEAIGNDVVSILRACDRYPSCDGGCYHRVMKEVALKLGTTNSSLQQLTEFCLQTSESGLSHCFNGLGHGLTQSTSYNLEDSLSACDNLSIDPNYQTACYVGVFTEMAKPDPVTGYKPDSSIEDFLSTCGTIAQKYQRACFVGLPERAIAAGNSIAQAASMCGNVQEEEWQQACSEGVYKVIIRRNSSSKQKQQECLAFGQMASKCFFWVVKQLTGTAGKQKELSEFCADLEDKEEQACQEGSLP